MVSPKENKSMHEKCTSSFDKYSVWNKVGALEACYMAKRGYDVHLYEYRKGYKKKTQFLNSNIP